MNNPEIKDQSYNLSCLSNVFCEVAPGFIEFSIETKHGIVIGYSGSLSVVLVFIYGGRKYWRRILRVLKKRAIITAARRFAEEKAKAKGAK